MRPWFVATAVALGVGLAAYPFLAAPEGRAVAAIGGAGLLAMAGALTSGRLRGLVVPAAILLALHYGAALHAGNVALDVYAPVVAIALFLFVEAMDAAISISDVAPMTRPALTRRMLTSGVVASAGGLLALLGVLARSLFAGAATGVVVGAACVLGLVALPLWVAQRE